MLEGKRVLVVGGGGDGNGRAITRAVAAAHAHVAVVDIDPVRAHEAADEITAAGGTAIGLAGDVTSPDDVERLVTTTVEEFSGLDVLITVVGGFGAYAPWVPADQTTDDDWDLITNLNIKYVFRFARAAIRTFLTQPDGGTIVSVGSIAGVASSPGAIAYGAAKAGLINMAATISIEYARDNIRMNVISCGYFLTPAARLSAGPEYANNVPMGRPGDPQEVANAALFLASPHSAYISGQNLNIDGAGTARHPFRAANAPLSGQGAR